MRATSKDVAHEAQVSRATVSYVLNRTPGQTIPLATRQRVLDAAARLGYTPDASARALRSGTSSLALLVSEELPFSVTIGRLVDRLTRGAVELGLSLVTWQRGEGGDLASTLANLRPRIVIAMVGLSKPERTLLENADIPVVDLAGGGALIPYGLITGQVQVQRLALSGHRRLAAVTTTNPALSVFANSRLEGVRRGCHELGLPEPEVLELDDPDEAATGRIADALSTWRAGADPVTGVCAYNDVYAGACLAAARTGRCESWSRFLLRVPPTFSPARSDRS